MSGRSTGACALIALFGLAWMALCIAALVYAIEDVTAPTIQHKTLDIIIFIIAGLSLLGGGKASS